MLIHCLLYCINTMKAWVYVYRITNHTDVLWVIVSDVIVKVYYKICI